MSKVTMDPCASGGSSSSTHSKSSSFCCQACLRPGADQSSKAAFAKTCFLLLKIRLVHINRAKSKNAFEHVLAESILFIVCAKTCSNILLLFARLVCASHIFNKRKHVLAKAALLDWSAPGLRARLGWPLRTKACHARYDRLYRAPQKKNTDNS